MTYKFKSHLDWAREHHRQARAAAKQAEASGADFGLLLEFQRIAAIAERDLQRAMESAS
jgi:hypothetical protein